MTAYTVTITPDDPGMAVTTIRLDITDSAAAISELRLTPGAGGGLAAGGLPVLDLNNLVAAVVASVVPASRAPKPAAATTPTPAAAGVSTEDAAPAPLALSRKAAGKRAAAKKPAAKKTTAQKTTAKKTSAKAAEAKSTPAKAARPAKAAKKTTSAPAERASRTYRRVPDDFEQVLRQAGDSANIVADHYGVPRHTAYSWIRSARKKVA
ncbi:hypothetical protein [Hamadaea sp.]|uniref:hypothetical protein n=1 Tax=Hamadaea sp. TaxID=2024425 RepID=UPI0025C33924|nr:hypothetical protein [Hamadaea sp.]